MTDRPILFSAPMISALGGRKTQTRRLLPSPLAKCIPGDRLWVRESFVRKAKGPQFVGYVADGRSADIGERVAPGIHLPRPLSRFTLIVTAVSEQRLQDLTEADARAEGITSAGIVGVTAGLCSSGVDRLGLSRSAREAYARLWDHLHGAGSWDKNPTVLALSFTVHGINIDRLPALEAAHAP